MKRIAALLLTVGAIAAQAQAPAPAQPAEPPKKPLNLKLEEGPARSQPRINFDGRDDKAAPANLPALGGAGLSFERAPASRSSDSGSSPFPKDTNPNQR